MESGILKNSAMSASSEWGNAGHEAFRGRLHMQPKLPVDINVDVGCWVASTDQVGEWLQVSQQPMDEVLQGHLQ